jgi:hypothetical protein
MLRKFDGFEHIRADGTGFNQCSGLDGTNLGDRNLKDLLTFGDAHGPRLTDQATYPDAVMSERTEAMPDQRSEGALINALTAWSAKGRVQRVDDAPEGTRRPGPSFGGVRQLVSPGLDVIKDCDP